MKALLAAVLAAVATTAVLATVGFGAANKSSTDSGPPPTQAQAMKDMQTQRDTQQKKLADALGVSTEKLQGALDTLRQQHLDQQVKDNLLTQEQADAIKACKADPLKCDRSNLPAPRFHGPNGTDRPSRSQMRKRFQDMQKRHQAERTQFAADLAKLLGVDEAKVKSALEANRPAGGPGRHGGPGKGGPGMGGPGMGGPGHGGPGHGGPGHGGPGMGGPPPGADSGASYGQPDSAASAVLS